MSHNSYVYKGIIYNVSRKKWMLVSSEYVSKQPKRERSGLARIVERASTTLLHDFCDVIVASGHVLPFVLIFSGFNEKVMPRR
jgi:hypothetical protein